MRNRVIKSRARSSSAELAECLSSLFTLELLSPSEELYLISPWVSDMEVVSNQLGQLRAVLREAEKRKVRLAEVLSLLSTRGTEVRIMCLPEGGEYTQTFLNRLAPGVQYKVSATLHEKGLLTSRLYLRGSMNFTYNGITQRDESIELTDDREAVALALVTARNDWEGL